MLAARHVEGAGWHEQARAAGIDVRLFAGRREIAAAVRDARPDIAHVHFFGLYVPVALALARRPGRLFWHMHSTVPDAGSLRERAKGLVRYRVVGRRVERLIAVSPSVAEELRVAHAPPEKITVIPNAVDTARFRPPTPQERAESRSALGIEPPARALLFFGRDSRIKGADTLHDALERDPRGADTLVVVGADPATLEQLRRRAHVVAVQTVADTRPLYWAADALVMPSRGEGLPFVLLEALATGLPAAVSAIPAVREVIAQMPGVASFPPEDPAALADALVRLPSLGPADPQPVRARYDLERWADAVLALYDAPVGCAGAK